MKDSQTAIAMTLVETGSDYETKENNGLSHFLEHMCFKGTRKRTGEEIKLELDTMGSQSNAFTGDEYTGYWAKAHYKKAPKLIDLISDIYLNPTFPQKDIDIERGVITEEYNMYEDQPQRSVWYVWDELLYGDQPAGFKIIGTKENINKFQHSDFVQYHEDHYIPQKTVVVIAGNIDQTKVTKQLKDIFSSLPRKKVLHKKKVTEKQTKPQVKVQYKKTDQTHIVLGFRAFKKKDKRNTALGGLAMILGSGFSSRLSTRMRDELGMCYYVYASDHSYTTHGYFTISVGVNKERAQEAVEVILEECRKICTEPVSEKELHKVKEMAIGSIATGLETSDDYASLVGFQELLKKEIRKPEEKLREIKAVTPKDLQKVAKQVFKNESLNLAIVGPFKDEKKFKKLLKIS